MIVRAGNESDIVKASRLWLEMVKEMRPEWTPNVEWWRKIAVGSMRSGTYFVVVADEGGKLVGFLDWFIFDEPSTGKTHAVGQHLFLRPELRGSGIGRNLYDKAMEAVKDMGINTVELFCFENEKPMWEKRGFAPVRSLLRKEI